MTQPDMSQILAQAQQMQAKLQEAQREILATTVTGTAGNGLVSIDMQGNGMVSSVTIDPKVVDADDVETLQDLLVGAFAEAHEKLSTLAEQKMGPLSQGFDGLGGMF
ncbi:YbaB/EbfC family nucleoid-associated protein [Corynebacterium diphtheriae]|nr:YbaB/EbfC family nucleoid-associated protein [Corynebacterium diphtheriae]